MTGDLMMLTDSQVGKLKQLCALEHLPGEHAIKIIHIGITDKNELMVNYAHYGHVHTTKIDPAGKNNYFKYEPK